MRIEFLLIGDELLTGEFDPYPLQIVQAVRRKGAYVSRVMVLPDDVAQIVSELTQSRVRGAHLLLLTGGLGPTMDDVTRHALASFLGRPLVVDPEAKEWMEEDLRRRHGKGSRPPPASMLMAMVPEGTKALPNPAGVACGIEAAVGNMTIICVPGFPKEMQAMFEAYFLPRVRDEGLFEKELWVMMGESYMEPIFQAVAREFRVRIASLPQEDWRERGNQVIIRGEKGEVERASKRFLELVEDIKEEDSA